MPRLAPCPPLLTTFRLMNAASHTDISAVIVTAALMAFQCIVLTWTWFQTLRHLGRQRGVIGTFTARIGDAREKKHGPGGIEPPPTLARAWRATRPTPDSGSAVREVLEPREAFDAERLVPYAYNGRLDAAAPGVFTALGIVGTFVGLIIAFAQVDPSQSANSITPLIDGMSIAFWNSLVGVLLSILWTIASRRSRHSFDRACRELVDTIEDFGDRVTPGGQVLTALASVNSVLGAVVGRLDDVRDAVGGARSQASQEATALSKALGEKLDVIAAATRNSSSELMNTLAPQLEKSFRTLVDTPFQNLSATVAEYRQTVEQVAERHTRVLAGLDAAIGALGTANSDLVEATEGAATCVREFASFVERVGAESERATAQIIERSTRAGETLEAQTREAATVLEAQTRQTEAMLKSGQAAADAMGAGAEAFRASTERQGEMSTMLAGAASELRSVAGGLEQISTTFGAAAERLEAAVGQVQNLGVSAAEDTARAAREELQEAVTQMTAALTEFGDRNVKAYEASSGRVVQEVDGRMSDLTDRMSAELNTLTVRLPDVAESMTGAAKMVRTQLERAVRQLNDAVRQLDVSSGQSLKARLEEYDGAVAKAVDHFSGTLLLWDGKVAALTDAVRDIESAIQRQRDIVDGADKAPLAEITAASELPVS